MITQTRLKELFDYKDGFLIRRVSVGRSKIGDIVGSLKSNGYIQVNIDKKNYRLHRIVSMYHYGYMPEFIDHIDGNRQNNNILNLRQATREQNSFNTGLQKNNKSGVKGVYWNPRLSKWIASMGINGTTKHLGVFKTKDLAKEFVELAREMLHGSFANHGQFRNITDLTTRLTALKGK